MPEMPSGFWEHYDSWTGPGGEPPLAAINLALSDYLFDLNQQDALKFRDQYAMRMRNGVFSRLADLADQIQTTGGITTLSQLYKLKRYQDTIVWMDTNFQNTMLKHWDASYAKTYEEASKQAINVTSFMINEAPNLQFQNDPAVVQDVLSAWHVPNFRAVEGLYGRQTLGQSKIKDYFAAAFPEAATGMTAKFAEGLALGINPKKIAKECSNVFGEISLSRLNTIARTEMIQGTRIGQLRMYEESGIVKFYKRIAAKQGRTCGSCLALDGTVYPITQRMPTHPNDRCGQVPVVEGMPELSWETGEEWLKKQPLDIQEQVLGKSLADHFRKGDFELNDLVTIYNDPVWGPTLRTKGLGELAKIKDWGLPPPKETTPDDDLDIPGSLLRSNDAGKVRSWTKAELLQSTEWLDENEAAFSPGAQKHEIVSELARRTGLPYQEVNRLVRQWAETSNDTDYRSLFLQERASELYGTPLTDWQKYKINLANQRFDEHIRNNGGDAFKMMKELGVEKFTDLTPDQRATYLSNLISKVYNEDERGFDFLKTAAWGVEEDQLRSILPLHFEKYWDGTFSGTFEKVRESSDTFLRAMYQNTQDQLKASGMTHVVLFRGTSAIDPKSVNTGDLITISQNTLESWSSKKTVAQRFGPVVIQMEVPISRVFASCRTGFGCQQEWEYVLLGGHGDDEALIFQIRESGFINLGED